MTSTSGPRGPIDHAQQEARLPAAQTIELQLVESLVHHLIEKGVLTKNDALSVVQTVAEVKRCQLDDSLHRNGLAKNELTILECLYSSFELVPNVPNGSPGFGGENVLQLRPPLHGDQPSFPRDD